jgi:oxygen-independent coproporphyrinogen-3 oxidase
LVLRKNEINAPIETIYFGGGTPSILSVSEINLLLKTINNNYQVIDNPEITLEANPDDLSNKKIRDLAKTAINRLSIGVQSFFNDDLKFMNRAHTAEEAIESLKTAVKYFDNITIDLIYGTPNLSLDKWKKNLQITFDLGINHISSYALTIETKTALYQFIKKGKVKPLDEELALEHFTVLLEETKKNNYIQYETSNFGKEGYFSKHNTSYWLGKNYLGVGPSAHSFNGKTRSWNVRNNTKYIAALENNLLPLETEILSVNNLFNETIMIGLRTIWGVSLDEIELKFGKEIKKYLENKIKKYLKNNTLKIENKHIIATQKGKFLIDGIASDLFIVS